MNPERKLNGIKYRRFFPSSFESGFAQIRTETINHEFLSPTIGLRNTTREGGGKRKQTASYE